MEQLFPAGNLIAVNFIADNKQPAMKNNIGLFDRFFRVTVAAAIILLYYTTDLFSGTVAAILLILSAIFIATGFIGFCPLYLPFRLRTNRRQS